MTQRSRRAGTGPESFPSDAPWTLVGPGSVIHGELLMSGNVLVHGRIEGVLFTDGEVRVAPGGSVDGGIHARRIVIEGSCVGRLEAAIEIQLGPGAVVRGDLEARYLTIEDGARFIGDWKKGDAEPTPRSRPYENSPGHA